MLIIPLQMKVFFKEYNQGALDTRNKVRKAPANKGDILVYRLGRFFANTQ